MSMFGGFGSMKEPGLGRGGRGNRSVPSQPGHRDSNQRLQQTTKPLAYGQVVTQKKGRSTKSS